MNWKTFLWFLVWNKDKTNVTVAESLTSSGFFIEDIQRGGIIAAWSVAGSLASSLVTRLVGVPPLPTVVAELCVTPLAATAQLGTLSTAVSYHCIAEEREKLQVKKK